MDRRIINQRQCVNKANKRPRHAADAIRTLVQHHMDAFERSEAGVAIIAPGSGLTSRRRKDISREVNRIFTDMLDLCGALSQIADELETPPRELADIERQIAALELKKTDLLRRT